jgi:hypothetical protein
MENELNRQIQEAAKRYRTPREARILGPEQMEDLVAGLGFMSVAVNVLLRSDLSRGDTERVLTLIKDRIVLLESIANPEGW